MLGRSFNKYKQLELFQQLIEDNTNVLVLDKMKHQKVEFDLFKQGFKLYY